MSLPLVPNRGGLVNLVVDIGRAADLKSLSAGCPSWTLTPRQLYDLELLAIGGLSPLAGFMTRPQYESVRDCMRLPDGTPWPVPLVLDVREDIAATLAPGSLLGLRDEEGRLLAVVHVEDVWPADEWGATSFEETYPYFVGGHVEVLATPSHFDFPSLRIGPAGVRADFEERGWRSVAALVTSEPLHRAQVEATNHVLEKDNLQLFVAAVTGPARAGEVEHFTRIRCYQAALSYYASDKVRLGVVPMGARASGSRTIVWHAILASNFGCTHLIVDADRLARTEGVEDSEEVAAMRRICEREIGVRVIVIGEHVYLPEEDRYVPSDLVPAGISATRLAERELSRRLRNGEEIPEWASFPTVVRELRRAYPPRTRQGFAVFFTGLSGSGKSTIANVLLVRLLELDHRAVRLLDGDVIRLHLTSELGFSKAHRDLNVQRIAFVASEITQCGGTALCAAIAPYHGARRRARSMIEATGGFVLVHVSTPLAVCEARDAKGLYAKARAGAISRFTGVTDPYEPPTDADIVIDTTTTTAEAASEQIVAHLRDQGYLGHSAEADVRFSAAQ
jgi:sulfate adenylyltransferase